MKKIRETYVDGVHNILAHDKGRARPAVYGGVPCLLAYLKAHHPETVEGN